MSAPVINNKKARFEYELLEKYIAGIVLNGPEIKSIRKGKSSIAEAYCTIENGELWIRHMHVAPYVEASYQNEDPLRERKLLVTANELKKIERQLRDNGITIVPLKIFVSDKGWAKVEIATARGKKLHDKRHSIQEKDVKRDLDRAMKGRN